MPTLHIEHAITDRDVWLGASDGSRTRARTPVGDATGAAASRRPEVRRRRPRVRHVAGVPKPSRRFSNPSCG